MRRMFKYTFSPVLVLLLLLLFAAEAAFAGRGLDRLNYFFSGVVTMQGSFTQTVVDDNGDLVQEAAGTLKLLRPGRFRWDYQTPFKQLIVSDGQFLWIYDEELAQATVRDIGAALGATPIMLLSEIRPVEEDFTVINEVTEGDLDWVDLAPKMSDTDFRRIRFGLDSVGLRQMILHDQFGQKTTIVFSQIRINEEVAASAFRFQVPPGVDLINAAQ